jgi:hypothetical protein
LSGFDFAETMSLITSAINYTLLSCAGEQLATPRLDRLYRDWCAAAADDVPGLDFALPERLQYLRGSLLLLDVEHTGPTITRYRYRMIGTSIVARRGLDRTGDYLDTHPETAFADTAIRGCDLVLKSRRPLHASLQRELLGRQYLVEIMVLPLAGADGEIERLLAAQLYPHDAPMQPYADNGLGMSLT